MAQRTALCEQLTEDEIRPAGLRQAQLEAIARDVERLQTRRNEFVTINCPACGSASWRLALEKYSFTFVTCRDCRTLFMNPRPPEAVMAWYYGDSETYRYWARHTFPASEAARREKIHKPWLKRVIACCDEYGVPRRTLLEVGAGFGTFASLVQESGAFARVLVVEPTPDMARACRERGLEVIEKRAEEIAGDIDAVDVAVAFEVIEHLFEPRRFLDRMQRLLRPGGLLVLSCPNGLGFDVVTLGPQSQAIDAEHVNLFNPASLRRLVEGAGFEVLSTTTPGRLDAELVRTAILGGRYDVSDQPFLKRVLLDEWERLGWSFQKFLAENGLSSHTWVVARRAG